MSLRSPREIESLQIFQVFGTNKESHESSVGLGPPVAYPVAYNYSTHCYYKLKAGEGDPNLGG